MERDNPILYGGALSYFTGKARSYLNYKRVTFEERLATPDVYKSIIMPGIGYPMIPVTVLPDNTLIQDTTELMDYFEALLPQPSVQPSSPKQKFVSALMELYGDEWLIIPAMHYRWAYNHDFAVAEFGKLALPDGTQEEQSQAGEKASSFFQKSVSALGVTPNIIPAIEVSYTSLLQELHRHFEQYDFLLGGRPCAGDFGLIGPLYAHLYRDPFSREIMETHGPAVCRWVERMIAVPFEPSGEFLPDDTIPDSLLPILQRLFREQGPCLLDIIDKTSSFKAKNPDTDIPRALGFHEFEIEDKRSTRAVFPYTQWMAQRAFEPLQALSEAEKSDINALLKQVGGQAFIGLDFKTPLIRTNHKLAWRSS